MLYKYLRIEIRALRKKNSEKEKQNCVIRSAPMSLRSNQCNALLMGSTLIQFVKNRERQNKSKTFEPCESIQSSRVHMNQPYRHHFINKKHISS
jgi:hypothetical protein